MPTHEYTPREALDLIIRRIDSASPELATRIQAAIDEGKDVSVEGEEIVTGRRRRRRKYFYRKNVALTDEEALQITIVVLQSHLVETRKIMRAAQQEFTSAGLGRPRQSKDFEASREVLRGDVSGQSEPKTIEIEVEPETVLEKQNVPNLRLGYMNDDELQELENLLSQVKALTDFS